MQNTTDWPQTYWGNNTGETWSNSDDWYQAPSALQAADAQAADAQAAGPQIVDSASKPVHAESDKPVHADDGQSDAGESKGEREQMLFIPDTFGRGQTGVKNFAKAERAQPYVQWYDDSYMCELWGVVFCCSNGGEGLTLGLGDAG